MDSTIAEFIPHIIQFESIEEILNICKTESKKGFVYERLWDVCIKFGFCDHFQKSDFTHMVGNMNNGNLKPLTTFTHYLTEKVVSGNSSGCSDISLFNNTNDAFTFITSKYPKSKDENTKQKSVAYYEVQNIISVIDANKHIYPNFKIFLLVPDKKSVLEKVKNANKSSNYITKYMTEENILDKNDLNKCFLRFKADIIKHMKASKNGKINYDEIYLSPKCSLSLRFHQELITQKTSNLIEEGKKTFLWGCKCRSGKTYMIGGLIIKQLEIKQKLNVLIITPAPTETIPQFTDDLFNKFKEFEAFKIHHIDGSKNIEDLVLEKNNIFIMSKQLLQKYIDNSIAKDTKCELLEEIADVVSAKRFSKEKALSFKKKIIPLLEDKEQYEPLIRAFVDFEETLFKVKPQQVVNKAISVFESVLRSSPPLIKEVKEIDKTIMNIKNLKLDIIGFDENHFSGTTDLSKSILDSYSSKNTIKVYLTATYNKPLREWNIPQECQMYWDIEDEQICKSILLDDSNIDKLKDKHGDTSITSTIKYFSEKGLSLTDMFKSYKNMPDMYLITTMFDSQRYDIIKEKIMSSKYGFCFEVLFALNKQKTKFQYENEVKIILRFISGSNKEVDFKHGDKSMFSRILKICSDKETRTPFTQIWFLPTDNINEISKCLEQLMKEDNVLKKYNTLCINRKNKDLAKDIKEDITKHEKIAKSEGKEGLILLAGNMLTLGITLNMCDVVALMNNTLSSDKVLQQMYRCMTEGSHKKLGFVVDLNISRVLNTCVNYTIYKNDKSTDDKIKYLIENHLINIDVDMMEQKKLNSGAVVSKLMEIWKSDPINSFKSLLRNLDNDYVEFDTSTQKLLNKSFTSSLKDDKVDTTVEFKDEDDELQVLPTGKEKVRDDSDKSEKSESGDEEETHEKDEIKISFTKDVLPYVIPLTCILTIKNANKDFVKMLNDIQENPELLDIFDDMCLIWWNKKDLIDIIKDIVSKYFDKNSNTYNISINFKMSLQSLIDSPKELLELINECLKPKEIEKKENGEVFTPIKLVNDMLDKLPIEVWKNKNLKWLDPCCGMGNFPIVVYLRLMEGLKDEIKDMKERKKHILENMLYMSELNKKNVLVCKQIFDINNELKLNIYEGDSLKVDYNKVFKIKQFDIIIGNPPYNASGTKASGNTIWQLFVNNSIKLLKPDGYICFVHPNGWRKPNTERGKLYGLFDMMTKDNTILYLEIHDSKDGMKQFSCGTRYDWYILQKKKNENHKTKIIDQNNVLYEINLIKYNWLANCELELIDKLIANENEEKCKIIISKNNYETRKKWISKIETKEFKYPVVHSTPKNGHRFIWSNRNDNGFYGIKKIIFGDSGIYNPIIDIDGKYAMSEHAMAIIIDNIKEGEILSKVLCSSIFEKILKACLWSSFAIEWGMFKDLKKNFYELLENEQLQQSYQINEKENIKNENVQTEVIVEEDVKQTSEIDYSSMKKPELEQLCRDRKLKGFYGKNKNVLIEMLSK
jgi:hypothetical protein